MATYFINQNAIIEIQMLGRLHGQRTRNIFHYRYTGTTQLDGPSTIDSLLAEFRTECWQTFRALLSNEYVCEGIQAQLVKPTRYRARFLAVSEAGTVVGNSLPSSVCVVLRRKAILAGRQYQGRVFIPGVPVQSEADSKLAPAVLGNWTFGADVLKEALEGGTAVEPFVPNLGRVSDASSALYDIDTVELDQILRQQRRREIGVGE